MARTQLVALPHLDGIGPCVQSGRLGGVHFRVC